MNIHHLELFYYVARHGGISGAVRNIPYGLQQPAMSSQVIQLEEFLGTALFVRRPFSLTPAGQELYEFIRPFFENLGGVADGIRGGVSQHIRVGASGIVLRSYLPDILQAVRKKFPKLKLTLKEGHQADLEAHVQNHEIDLAITVLDKKPPPGTKSLALFELPLILLVPKSCPLKSAQELWQLDRIDHPLISLPTNQSIYKHFQKSLARLKVDWFTRIEVSTLDLVEAYVLKGFGLGLSVAIPQQSIPPKLKALPLQDVEPVTFGMLSQGKLSPVLQAFREAVSQAARALVGPQP